MYEEEIRSYSFKLCELPKVPKEIRDENNNASIKKD